MSVEVTSYALLDGHYIDSYCGAVAHEVEGDDAIDQLVDGIKAKAEALGATHVVGLEVEVTLSPTRWSARGASVIAREFA